MDSWIRSGTRGGERLTKWFIQLRRSTTEAADVEVDDADTRDEAMKKAEEIVTEKDWYVVETSEEGSRASVLGPAYRYQGRAGSADPLP